MSFLLDALGKADDDRRRAMVPQLRASRYQRRSPTRRALSMVLIIGALVLSFGLGYIARPYLESRLSAGSAEVSASAAQSPAVVPRSPSLQPDNPPLDNEVAAKRVPEVQPEPVSPADSIELSVISYATKPTARFVMLDGVVMYEGDMLDEEIRLLLIKPDGVVMEKNGQEFSIDLGGPR